MEIIHSTIESWSCERKGRQPGFGIDSSCFLLTFPLPFDTLRCWQRSAHGSPPCAIYRSWQSRREASLTTLTNPHRRTGRAGRHGKGCASGWVYWTDDVLLGLALHLCWESGCYAIHTLLRPKAEHRDCEASSHICTQESQKPEFGHLGSRCHSGKWIFAVRVMQNFKGAFFLSVLCRIKHPNIVSLEDLFESKSHRYLVMQLWVLVCGFSLIFFPLCADAFCFPHIACHMPLTRRRRYIWHMDAHEQTPSRAAREECGSSASHLQPVISPPTSARTHMSAGIRNTSDCYVYAFVTGPLTIKEINDVGGGKLKYYESLSGKKHEKNSCFFVPCLCCLCACVCARLLQPLLGFGFDSNKREVICR